MSRYVDTHCHLQRPEFDDDRDAVVDRAREAGVAMLTIATDARTSRDCVRLSETYDDVYACVGIHPNDTANASDEDMAEIRRLATEHDTVVALGETGLDYYRDRAPKDVQRRFLDAHLELAAALDLPVVLHARSSGEDLLDAVEPFLRNGGRAVWHCFVTSKKFLPRALERAVELGLYLGVGGMITFEDQKPLRNIIPQIPDKHLLLDTDAPFLNPRPHTSPRNEPAKCIRIAEELAVLRGVSVEDVARITTRNACRFLALPLPEDQGKIAYVIRNSLYLALTNDCTNNCAFCARNQGFVVKGHDIHLDHDPSAAEVIAAMGDTTGYDEVVFCGFGESTMRLDVLKAVATELKARGQTVRLNTNGLANLYYERNIVPELVGLIDVVSVSLNTADPCQYHRMCNPRFGHAAYGGVCEFVKACVAAGLRTVCTVVDMPEIDVDAARERAHELGAEFRVRSYVDAG